MKYKISFTYKGKRKVTDKVFKNKLAAKKAISEAINIVRKDKGVWGKRYRMLKNPRIVKLK